MDIITYSILWILIGITKQTIVSVIENTENKINYNTLLKKALCGPFA